jgi:hypothetical protein
MRYTLSSILMIEAVGAPPLTFIPCFVSLAYRSTWSGPNFAFLFSTHTIISTITTSYHKYVAGQQRSIGLELAPSLRRIGSRE